MQNNIPDVAGITSNQIMNALHWRYATKHFDPTKRLSDEQVQTLLEVLRLSPSSYGVQPWKFFVIENPDVRTKIKEAAWNQDQVSQASHLLVLARRTTVTNEDIAEYVDDMAKTRKVERVTLAGFEKMMQDSIEKLTEEQRTSWAARQVYLALGFLLQAASLMNIDAAPMEGFVPEKVDEILGLKEKGYASTVLCALGFRATDDAASHLVKVRYPVSRVIEWVR